MPRHHHHSSGDRVPPIPPIPQIPPVPPIPPIPPISPEAHESCGGFPFGDFAGLFASGRRSFSFGPGGFHFNWGDDGRGGWGGHRRDRRRMFESGELRLVLLKLIADEPRHGYQLIKAIEDLTEGDYAPSPGVVYPTLTMLEDMGLICERKSKDSKKVFEATDEGRSHLEENEDEVEDLFERLEGHGRKRRHGQRPEIGRAIGNLMTALRNRVAEEGWNEELLQEVIDILDEAAQRVERVK